MTTVAVRRAVWSLFVLSFLVLVAATGAAQQGTTVSGTLSNSLSGENLANATVTIEELSRAVRTGADGRFTIPNVPPGRYHLLVRAEGFTPKRSEITVAEAAVTADLLVDPQLHFTEVVSVSPESVNQFDSFQPTNVLAGQELQKELQGTIGDTLQYEPGIATRSFGPGPARPVIRGLDGDRVLILEDGGRMGDLSSQSGDHGVNVNPGSASRIEVVRGPATLLYGANAIGGLVNVISNGIPTEPVTGAHGGATFDLGSAANEGAGGGDVTVGNGRFALHAGGSGRRTGDYDTPEGEIPNSFTRGGFGEVGASWTGPNGYLGGNYAYDRTHYGIPFVEEGETNIDPRRHIFNLRGERRFADGFFSGVRAWFGVRRYRHDEKDGDLVVTEFKNNITEFDVRLNHRGGSKLKGSFGGWVMGRAYDSIGEEALAPPVDQNAFAGFVYEEITATPHVTFQFGGRIDHSSYDAQEAAPSRDFTDFSGSLGLLFHPTDATTVAFSFARASRNPALEELYNNGPHVGNFAFEIGDPDLDSEHALGFDVSFRWRATRASGEVTYFFNDISDFIFRRLTGEIEDDLPVTVFTAGDSRLQGVESHVDVAVSRNIWIEGGLDYVRGELTALDQPLPRMPPLRGRLGGRFQRNGFQAGIEGVFAAKQDRIYTELDPDGVPVGETPTDGYNLMKLFGSYSFGRGGVTNTITARLDNSTNELYRNHLNYLKDLAPEVGRNFKLLYSVRF
jgi:iron complex outermembrane receptor protein